MRNYLHHNLEPKKSLSKIAKTERTTAKQDLMEYFKKERNTLNQVTSNIKTQLQQSRSIDNLNSQKSERLQEHRIHTEESSKMLKPKNPSLVMMEPRQIKTKPNHTPLNAYKMPKSTVDQYFQDLTVRKQVSHTDFSIRHNKQSLLQESMALKQSIERILTKNKSMVKKVDLTSSINQSSQQRSDSLKKFIRADESGHYDIAKHLKITLVYKEIKYNYLFEYVGKTTDDLFNYLIQQTACIEKQFMKQGGGTGSTEEDQIQQEVNKICQFQSVRKNIPHDYYLSLPDLPLSVFQGISLQLQPLLSQPLSGKRVGLRDFTLVKCIGVGGFSRVYLVRKKDNGKFYAMKLIDKNFILENQKEVIVQNERDIMARMDSQFVTPLHYAFETKYYIAFVMEYCAGGELFYHLRKLKRLTEQDAKYYFVEICVGMAYLHSQHIVYRDIKPENILLDLQGHLLLSDFGLSKPGMAPDDFAYSFCGSPEYMAPEMLMKSGHNYLVDCYCLGALLYELVTGLPPFYSHNTQEIYQSILTEQVMFPPYVQISEKLQSLIYQLLEKDPNERLGQNQGIVEILTHPWFADVDFEKIVTKKLKPPYKPQPLQYNFDEEEFNKGDAEFRKQYSINLQKEFINTENNPNLVLKNFYFCREEQQKQNRTNNIQSDLKRLPKHQGKTEIYDFVKKHEPLSKSASLVQSTKHAYSKTMQQQSEQQLKIFGQISSERVAPELRLKTDLVYPKTTTNQFQKQTNMQKLFGSKRK